MNTIIKNYKFHIGDKEISFNIEINNFQNVVILKSNRPLGDSIFINATWVVVIEEFEEDLSILIPEKLGYTDINTLLFFQLVKRIKLHVKKYQRLLLNDLETYIDETILLIEAITKAFKKTILNKEEKEKMFIDFKNNIIS